jgi:hypothetical protein
MRSYNLKRMRQEVWPSQRQDRSWQGRCLLLADFGKQSDQEGPGLGLLQSGSGLSSDCLLTLRNEKIK